ncbi:cytochrome P450, partial [Neoconidiobolus thromboides FSU 785]
VVYAFYLSPLKDLPGPWQGKLTAFYSKSFISKGQYHTFLEDLHDHYGPVVHFSPNRVSFATKKAADTIYSTYKFKKTPFYLSFKYGGITIFSTSDRDLHASRKKIHMGTLNKENLKKLEPTMVKMGFVPMDKKLKEISLQDGVCDVYKLIHQVLFNINGQLIISEDFDLLNKENLPVLDWLKSTLAYGVLQFEFPYIPLVPGNRYGKEDYVNFLKYVRGKILARKSIFAEADKKGEKRPEFNDILQLFLDTKDEITGEEFSIENLQAETVTGFIAGTDTTANTVIWTLKLLLDNPDKLAKLVKEIDDAFGLNEEYTSETVRQKVPYLEAVINEAMRLHPVSSGSLPRLVPKGGAVIEGYHIPEDTEVGIGIYAYHRSGEVWENSKEFIPERFLGEEGTKRKANFLPFLTGPRSCVGRDFAWMAMFHIFTTIFRKYTISYQDKKAPITPHYFLVLKPEESTMLINVKARTS